MKTLIAIAVLFLGVLATGVAAPKAANDYAKQIVGRWLGSRKFEIYYADGTWAVQRNETSKPDKDGRRWHVEGNKLTLTYPGGTDVTTITSMSKTKFVTKDDGYEEERTRADK